MVIMGGGPETPSPPASSKEKELVLAVLPWPLEQCQPGISSLEQEFPHLKVQHFYSHFENGKITVDDIPPHLLAQASYIATLFWLPTPRTRFLRPS